MAYPLKLKHADGLRRLAVLQELVNKEPITMMSLPHTGPHREDIRFLWRAGLVEVVGTKPLHYAVSAAGELAIEQAPAELKKIELALAKKEAKDAAKK